MTVYERKSTRSMTSLYSEETEMYGQQLIPSLVTWQ